MDQPNEMQELLKLAVSRKASDVHISPGMRPIFRVNGDLIQLEDHRILEAKSTKAIVYSVMAEDQQKEFEVALELDFSVTIPDVAGFRVNAYHQMLGVAAAFRVIPENVMTLDELHMPPVFKQLLELPNGLILVTGTTGSGKSTSQAAMVDHINTHHSTHIITIEDPIEFIHHSKRSLINQRQVHRDTYDFASALRSALREDPDVILVGEMRDLETIRLALTAAETGHLVLATLHTSSAPRAVSRIIDVFPSNEKNVIRNLLSESLRAVICQTLLKSLSGGRVAAFEIMLGTPAIRNLIREDRVAQMYNAIQTSSKLGMCTLDQYLEELLAKHLISEETAVPITVNRAIFSE